MRAKLTYGPFTYELDINEPRYTISIPKPMGIPSIMAAGDFDVLQPTPSRLNFRLKKPPRLGEVVEYEYEGEA